MKAKFILPMIIAQMLMSHVHSQETKNTATPFSIGQSVELESTILKEKRRINIYIPASYRTEKDSAYPVIYLLDGSMDEDIIHVSGLVQFLSFPWIKAMPEAIVVGIENVDRERDFTYPASSAENHEEFPTAGRSAEFISFMEKELIPYMEQNYRITSEKTIIGQSLGGLLATEILYRHTDLFDNYIIVSPSLWWDNRSLLNEPLPVAAADKRIFIGVGKEGEEMESLAKKLHTRLDSLSPGNSGLYFNYYEQLNHGDALHLALYDAFGKIFGRKED